MAESFEMPQSADRAREPVRFEVAGGDPESAARDLAVVHGAERWSVRRTDGEFAYRYTAVGDSDVSIRRSQLRGALRGEVPVGVDYVVTWITSGTARLDTGRTRIDLLRDVPALLPPDEAVLFMAEDHDQRLVHFGREYVHRVALEYLDLGGRPLRFDPEREPEPGTAARWQGALVALSRALRLGGPESEAWHEAKRSAATAFLDSFPPRVDDLPAVLGLPRNARLRAAVEYIHAHAAESVTVTELSDVAGLSVRSVQESFRRVFDVSPLTYLREVRLDRVRSELLELDPQAGVVGDVARRWGFAHLGRFSAAYAARFGEYPKQTLRR
ncbi:AraC family transcriptional regulator [Curtobacterium sp. VKM Ac-1376]|uniref:AraC family transcriptional regulator n=1 Tax=Curtobacterium sp. VKM Ac-1376 TaxID=123312 RepID=UPI00188B6307|nr:helix-turn-helix transcriptional regulator [Curtobacterium sp. VKM Ac-1376]MBF4613011.1 AraC family transcriptional regulator [Curtobacterium sp. VKM Ac-1376]